jgi:hypothetical protein
VNQGRRKGNALNDADVGRDVPLDGEVVGGDFSLDVCERTQQRLFVHRLNSSAVRKF